MTIHIFSRLLFIFLLIHTVIHTQANIKLPAIISNNMVLQQKSQTALWGWGDKGEKISILTSWNNKTTTITTGADGKWSTAVQTSKAGGPYTITFKGNNEIKIENVLLGEVWLASGQSNMEFFVGKTRSPSYTGVPDYEAEIKSARFPMIRQIDVANKNADEPQHDFKGDWKLCSPQTVDTFSAVAYYFARKVYEATGYPVGIINSTWGGTAIESWMKKEVLANDTDFSILINRYDDQVKNYPEAAANYKLAEDQWKLDTTTKKPVPPVKPNPDKSPYRLYNAMIAPLVPYTLKGIIWYQGENNAPRAYQYRKLFPAMIASWRDDFKNTSLPFYFVQISPHRSQNPELREAQLLTYRNVAHTGMAVTTDNGDSLDIHPRNKKLVGERLGLWALYNEYGKKNIVYSGPLYKSMKPEGNKIRISFDFADGGLIARDGQPLKEFTIAGDDQHFVPAHAEINGSSVVVWSDEISKPAAVRFAWRNVPEPNLFNKAGLPASPFRTDNWKGETEGKAETRPPNPPKTIIWKLDSPGQVGGYRPVILGSPTHFRDKTGTAISFDGIDDGLIVPVNPIENLDSFTVEILFKPATDGPPAPRLIHLEDKEGKRCTIELRVNPKGYWYLDTFLKNGKTDRGLTLIDSTKQHATDRWYWTSLVYDGKTMIHYVNGVKELEGSIEFGPTGTGEISIGVRLNKVNWFKGQIREIRIHSTALKSKALRKV